MLRSGSLVGAKDVRLWPLNDRREQLREIIPTLPELIRYPETFSAKTAATWCENTTSLQLVQLKTHPAECLICDRLWSNPARRSVRRQPERELSKPAATIIAGKRLV